MQRSFAGDFIYQAASLILALTLVHALYVSWIRPAAEVIEADQQAQMQIDPAYIPERSFAVIVRDFEQEACFVLMLWAIAIMGAKAASLRREHFLLVVELVPRDEGARIRPKDAPAYAQRLKELPEDVRGRLLPRALLQSLHRFRATGNIQDVSDTARNVCDAEAERLEAELSLVRYIAWAIPSIGFIGTVRGIGEALGQAHQAVEGNISGVTRSLGVAFNSTFVALLISIVLMFVLHQLQLQQERLVLDAESYLDEHLIQHLKSEHSSSSAPSFSEAVAVESNVSGTPSETSSVGESAEDVA